MRLLAATLSVAFAATTVSAADKNEDKAKEAAVAFLKAVKAKDVDAVMKASAVPFINREGETTSVIKNEAGLKAWVKERFEELTDTEKVPTEVEKISPFDDVKDKIKDEADRKVIEEAAGKDGFVAFVTVDGKTYPILIRVKDGKAKVVGLGR